MIIGIPKEIKNNEYRVAMTPSGTKTLVNNGHLVYIQAGAGVQSGLNDEEYLEQGAQILPTIEAVYGRAQLIVKVKEPIAQEYALIKEDQVVFTFFHFASSETLTRAMIESGLCALPTKQLKPLSTNYPY
jgi:alanine dehydrogenase